ncbi:Rieske (2Fe-2S) protein [Microbacterium sp. LTA6]|uniref:Rieske 2Fe-2S domain-containing protein n=1 Tax=Microbacterium sp. LTA6 TaxID=3129771 RepID=UPI00324C41D8
MSERTGINALMHKIGGDKRLDRVAATVSDAVGAVAKPTVVKNALSGSWLGHQLHPVLTDLPIGAWGAATVLDLTAGEEGAKAARRLVGFGILSAVPTAMSGASDWADTVGRNKRVGLVHGLANAAGTGLQAASWFARRRGHRGVGVVLSLLALSTTLASAYLGGHLSFVRGVGVNRTAFQHPTRTWTDVAADADITEGALARVTADGVPVLLARRGEELRAISAVCSHAGGPLDEGTLDQDGCVTCPWHGSRFRTQDGSVVRGPASVPQPQWEVRVDGGRIFVRSA